MNTYEFTLSCICPVDGNRINYRAAFSTWKLIEVEHLIELAASYADQVMFQEDLSDDFLAAFGHGALAVIGTHSGVRIITTRTTDAVPVRLPSGEA